MEFIKKILQSILKLFIGFYMIRINLALMFISLMMEDHNPFTLHWVFLKIIGLAILVVFGFEDFPWL